VPRVVARVVEQATGSPLRGIRLRLGSGFNPPSLRGGTTFFQFSLDAGTDRGSGYQADSTIEIRFVFTGFRSSKSFVFPCPAMRWASRVRTAKGSISVSGADRFAI
jgi:hypothetical protein